MKHSGRVALLLALWPLGVLAEVRDDKESYSLATATIRDVTYVEDMAPEFDGDVPMGSRFKVKVSGLRSLRGEVPAGISSFELTATHREVLKIGETISLLLKNEAGRVDVIHWEWLFTATCVPEELWRDSGLDGQETYKEVPTDRRGPRSCTIVDD